MGSTKKRVIIGVAQRSSGTIVKESRTHTRVGFLLTPKVSVTYKHKHLP